MADGSPKKLTCPGVINTALNTKQRLHIADSISAVGKNVLTFALSAITPFINLPIPYVT